MRTSRRWRCVAVVAHRGKPRKPGETGSGERAPRGHGRHVYGRAGAAHCQVLDMLHAGVVPLHKVNFDAVLEHEILSNYKLLQLVFTKLDIRAQASPCVPRSE